MAFHIPVLVDEVINYLAPKEGGIYLDCTLGGGGHIEALAKKTSRTRFIGIDQDSEALAYAKRRLTPFAPRIKLFQENFINLSRVIKEAGIDTVDGILFDLGVSFHQLTTPARGFGFDIDGPIDMRMNQSQPQSAFELIKTVDLLTLKNILKAYGEVRHAGRIAKSIIRSRNQLATTSDLKNIIAQTVPYRYLRKNLAQVFQAIRISVNNELVNLKSALAHTIQVLKKKDGL